MRGLKRNPVMALAGERLFVDAASRAVSPPVAAGAPAGRPNGAGGRSALRASPEVGRLVPRGEAEEKFESQPVAVPACEAAAAPLPPPGGAADRDEPDLSLVSSASRAVSLTTLAGPSAERADGRDARLGLRASPEVFSIPLDAAVVMTLKLVLAHDGGCFAGFCADAIAQAVSARAEKIGIAALARQGRI